MGTALHNIGIVSGLTLLSRVLGLVRDVAITGVFGTSALASAFFTAFTLPNLFRRLLGEGALTAALVPTLQDETTRKGERGALCLISEVASWTFLLAGLITGTAMLVLAAQTWWGPLFQDTGWAAPDTVARWTAAARLGVVLFPYLIFVCLAAVFSAALQLREHFVEPALNPLWLNLSMIGLLAYGCWYGALDDRLGQINWLCAGVLLGGALQCFVPAWALVRLGWTPRWSLALSPGVRQIARLMAPTLFGSAIYLVNTALARLFALSLDDSAATIINLSTRLMELPIGVFALSVATVVFPQISKHASDGRLDLLSEDFRRGLRLIWLVNIPAAAGLMVLAAPLTRTLFQREAFTAADTAAMAPVLALSALALPALAYVSLSLRAFYARKDTRTPVRAAWWSFLVNIASSLVLMRWFGVAGLALASSLAVFTQATFLQIHLAQVHPGLRFTHHIPHILKVSAASAAMAAAVYGIAFACEHSMATGGWRDIAGLALSVGAGIGVFASGAWLLRVEGRDELTALVRRKLKRRWPALVLSSYKQLFYTRKSHRKAEHFNKDLNWLKLLYTNRY